MSTDSTAAVDRPLPVSLPAKSAPGHGQKVPDSKDAPADRPRVDGKFLIVEGQRFWIKGVTYGTFAPDAQDYHFPPLERVDQDFRFMTLRGLNAVRVYTVPPRWLLDRAWQHGLRVMIGLPWEQHIAFLDDSRRRQAIETKLREGVRACTGHPAVLAYSIGNEIPASICRWHGPRQIERFLRRLFDAAKAEDPDALVTYVNFPSTEYLRLHFLDFITFNVYLEDRQTLSSYLARLQNIAGDKPLVMAEIGLDSKRNGLDVQANTLDWQVRATMAAGCSGAFVFSWTDEWWRGGHDILDWDFGLVTRERLSKPALYAVAQAFEETPFAPCADLPRVSVIICSYNGAKTLRDAFEGLKQVDYPNFEVILVDDGSGDATPEIGRQYGARVISTDNCGLSSARNTGLEAATGEFVVYLDDDASPDVHWLRYIVEAFLSSNHVALGGPNLSPRGTGIIADCVDNAPGGPVHVLIDDQTAEHVPGCNMAFRAAFLKAIGGFDPQFRAAGDDVDVCWRIIERGGTVGFAPAALVWHHRRKTISAYWKQQRGYGRAEALLERKWPAKYNIMGHVSWGGRLYGKGLTRMLGRISRIYHGAWGSAAFQSRYDAPLNPLRVLPMMPEWYLIILALALLSGMSVLWSRLIWSVPLLLAAGGLTVAQALLSASAARFSTPATGRQNLKMRALTAWLHVIQPIARLSGRLRHGLHAGRMRLPVRMAFPIARTVTVWREHWIAPEILIRRIVARMRKDRGIVISGGDYDSWDFGVRGGLLAGARVLMTVEEHGSGKQLFRFLIWPRYSVEGLVSIFVLAALAVGAVVDRAIAAYLIFTALTAIFAFRLLQEGGVALAAIERAVAEPPGDDPPAD